MRHRRAGLGGLRIGEELREPLGAYPATDLGQDRSLLRFDFEDRFHFARMALRTTEFPDEEVAALDGITTSQRMEPLEPRHDGAAGFSLRIAGHDPDVSVADRVAVIL